MSKKTYSKDMYQDKTYDANGRLEKVVFRCGYKEPITQKYKIKTKTWNVPPELKGKKEIQSALDKEKIEFRQYVKDLGKGLIAQGNMSFIEYARNEWLKSIEKTKSKSYAHRGYEIIDCFEEYFGNKLTFDQLTPLMVKNYFKQLMNKDISVPKIHLKKSLWDEIRKQYGTKNKFCAKYKISKNMIAEAENGKSISEESMIKICSALQISEKEYFDIKKPEPRYYKKESVMKHKRIMSAIFNNAIRDTILADNYTSDRYLKLEFPREIKTNTDGVHVVTSDEVFDLQESRMFLEALKQEDHPIKVFYLSALLLSGMRPCELNGLKWQDINFVNKTITVKRDRLYNKTYGVFEDIPKTDAGYRTFTMPQILYNVVLKYKEWYDEYVAERQCLYEDNEDHLIISLRGGLTHPDTPGSWMKQILEKYNLKKIKMYGLRHTFASQSIFSGADIKSIASRIGHADPSVTLKIYTHFLKDGDIAAADKFDELYSRT